ncbi:hypothetical protein TNCT_482771 [Trichonephila clavata]|uniref:Uncharacterized protein n=1 Tax=Trichonephila clavata TaxID=2740835 RepID=A0A8X6LSZ2_TRICU|nr:hypothetical protein TNCT_482771 [Trichonephila clavata]
MVGRPRNSAHALTFSTRAPGRATFPGNAPVEIVSGDVAMPFFPPIGPGYAESEDSLSPFPPLPDGSGPSLVPPPSRSPCMNLEFYLQGYRECVATGILHQRV